MENGHIFHQQRDRCRYITKLTYAANILKNIKDNNQYTLKHLCDHILDNS